MKEIKFRAWIKKEKKMYEVKTMDWFVNSGCTKKKPSNLCLIRDRLDEDGKYVEEIEKNDILSDNVKLMQFIGLKDKNGKEIYEGDILNWNNECTILIEWYESRSVGFGYEVLTQKDKRIVSFDIRFYRSEENAEVIGNIYENPELIEVNKK